MYDVILRNGTIYDGSGQKPYVGDVAIARGKIVKVGHITGVAQNEIDITDRAVMPGCIDAHSHSDLTLPVHNRAESSIRQGITTEVAGSCGWSLAPSKAETVDSVLKWLITGLVSAEDFAKTPFSWKTFGEYLSFLETNGIGTNLVPIVGQSLIRAHIVGTEKRAATKGEMLAMKALVCEAMEEGARGMSTGRSYEPGGFGDTNEIIELARAMAPYGGVYTSHIKSEDDAEFEAVEEAIEIGRRSGVSVEISHHKCVGKKNYGNVKKTLAMMEEARLEGVRVTCDVYPFDYAQVSMLWHYLPKKQNRMGKDAIAARLNDPAFRDEIREELKKNPAGLATQAENYIIVSYLPKPDIEWKTLPEIAGSKDLVDTVVDLLIESKMRARVSARMNEEDVRTVIAHPETMIGTDAFALDRDMGVDVPVHPRHYGTFPRVLGHYVRDVGLVSLEEMVKKTTSMPARKFGLADRGSIKEGYAADLMVFDPATIVDSSTAGDPFQMAPGIDYVFVNGKLTLDHGEYKPVFAGQVLRSR